MLHCILGEWRLSISVMKSKHILDQQNVATTLSSCNTICITGSQASKSRCRSVLHQLRALLGLAGTGHGAPWALLETVLLPSCAFQNGASQGFMENTCYEKPHMGFQIVLHQNELVFGIPFSTHFLK